MNGWGYFLLGFIWGLGVAGMIAMHVVEKWDRNNRRSGD